MMDMLVDLKWGHEMVVGRDEPCAMFTARDSVDLTDNEMIKNYSCGQKI